MIHVLLVELEEQVVPEVLEEQVVPEVLEEQEVPQEHQAQYQARAAATLASAAIRTT